MFCCSTHDDGSSTESRPSSTLSISAPDNHLAVRGFDEKALAAELNALSVQERNQIYEDIHGIEGVIEETPELVESSTKQLRENLHSAPRRKRLAFEKAIFLKPALVDDEKFLLMFLRATRFDPAEAASKMLEYFDAKLELFGIERLVERITLEDLGEEEMLHMYAGSSQFIRVSSTRVAHYGTVAVIRGTRDWKSLSRYTWYQANAAAEDEEVQKRGIVDIGNWYGESIVGPADIVKFCIDARRVLNTRPVRICAWHHLVPDGNAMDWAFRSMKAALAKNLRLRLRVHAGSPLEVKYVLQGYGITLPHDCFRPGQGIFSREHIDSYLEERRQIEAEWRARELEIRANSSDLVPSPGPKDVLMGRGQPYQTWPGNQNFAKIASEYMGEYYGNAQNKKEKTEISNKIVRRILEEEQGRFLQRTETGWVPVDNTTARVKTSQFLRALVRDYDASLTNFSYDRRDEGYNMSPDVQPKRARTH